MNHDLNSADVNIISLNYQGEPQSRKPLSPTTARSIAVKAFPKSAPVNFRSSEQFEGVKVFWEEEAVYTSCFFDGGEVDAWRRPVLSAQVFALTPTAWERWGRNPFLIESCLHALDVEAVALEDIARHLADASEKRSPFASQEAFKQFIRAIGLPLDMLARAILLAYESSNVTIHADQEGRSSAVASIMMGFIPVKYLQRLSFCSVCADFSASDRETIVIAEAPPVRKPSIVGNLFRYARGGQSRPDEPTYIDPRHQEVSTLLSRNLTVDMCQAILEELLVGGDWAGLTFQQKHEILVGYLESTSQGVRDVVAALARQWPLSSAAKEALNRLGPKTRKPNFLSQRP